MPNRTYRCFCDECWAVNRDGVVVSRHIYGLHQQRTVLERHVRRPVDGNDTTGPDILENRQSLSAIRRLHTISAELSARSSAFEAPATLVFASHPLHSQSAQESDVFNTGKYALTTGEPCNADILDYERWILESIRRVSLVQNARDTAVQRAKHVVLLELEVQLDTLAFIKRAEWDTQLRAERGSFGGPASKSNYHCIEPRTPPRWTDGHPTVLACSLLAVILQLICGLSDRDCAFVLQCLALILRSWKSPSNDAEKRALNSLGKDIRSVTARLHLEPITRDYICCPRCFKLYLLRDHADPTVCCTARSSPDAEPCGASLYRTVRVQGRARLYPARVYLHHDFHHWLARLLNRAGIEDLMDSSQCNGPASVAVNDIWGGTLLRNFKDRDGKSLFFRSGTGESRYAFSLCYDGFGPFGESSGKTVHCGGIFLVCLNLPLHLRYLEENMYLAGIIPGPNSPKLEELNYLMAPLVDDFCLAWSPGLHITRTAKHPGGRRVLCAVVPVVCDMVAAKQVLALASHTARLFCSYCLLEYVDINNLNCATWVMRKWKDWLENAVAYRDAPSQAERDALFDAHGVRYSELFRLPYFDPTQALTTETMHLFYLRAFGTHVRDVWKMTTTLSTGDANLAGESFGRKKKAPQPVSESEMRRALWTARHGSAEEMEKRLTPLKVLVAVCERLGVHCDETRRKVRRRALLAGLLAFRQDSSNQWPADTPEEDPRSRRRAGPASDAEVEEAQRAYRTSRNLRTFRVAALVCVAVTQLKRKQEDLDALNKEALIQLLESQRREKVSEEPAARPKRILGGVLMQEVRKDLLRTTHHSSVVAVPASVGSKAAGTISADHSRTFFMKNLVVTIIRVFGSPQHPMHSDARNFMHLVTAVAAAESRCNTDALTDVYARHSHAYLKGLLELHPFHELTPSQHTLLHVPRFLRSMGPVKGHRAFGFERFIFLLKSIPTNNKASEANLTMFRRMARRQNLRAFISEAYKRSPQIPSILSDICEVFAKKFRLNPRGSLSLDILGAASPDDDAEEAGRTLLNSVIGYPHTTDTTQSRGQTVPLSPGTVQSLRERFPGLRLSIPHCAQPLPSFAKDGETYRARRSPDGSDRDAQIVFLPDRDGREWAPGEVYEILVPLGTRGPLNHAAFALVERYKSLSASAAAKDMWRTFGPCAGRVYYLQKNPPIVVFPDQFVSPVTVAQGVLEGSVRNAHALFIPKDQNGVLLGMAIGVDSFLASAPDVPQCP